MKILPLLALVAFPSLALADVHPNPLFSDHMVVQQGKPLLVFGMADAGEKVTVTLGKDAQSETADAQGKWQVKLPEQKSGGLDAAAVTMTIAGKNTVTIQDVLIGEVWLGSGQSNMVFNVSKSAPGGGPYGLINEADEIKAASHPKIRMFTVTTARSETPAATVRGTWQVCSPDTVGNFSAVGYLFARELQRNIRQPVGIVLSAYGASTAEAWISREAMMADADAKPMLEKFDALLAFYKANPGATIAQAPYVPTPINKARPNPTGRLGNPVQDQHQPIVLYNAMISPIVGFPIKGVIWYQGESLVGGEHGVDIYPQVEAALIKDWRTRWGDDKMPFYMVQLPGQRNLSNNPRIREGQAAILKIPDTGLANVIDTGEAANVHPHNKAVLGDRLAKLALAGAYDQKVEAYGPLYDSMKVEGDSIRIIFTHADGMYGADAAMIKAITDPNNWLGAGAGNGAIEPKVDAPLKWFQIAGDDQKFVDAIAKIDAATHTIVVSSPSVKSPVAVRYAWDNYPDGANLYNKANLPATPFRTDNWKYTLVGLVE